MAKGKGEEVEVDKNDEYGQEQGREQQCTYIDPDPVLQDVAGHTDT